MQIEELIDEADLPSLLAALACALGDETLAPVDLWLDPARALEPDGGWDEPQIRQARALAEKGIKRCLAGEADPVRRGDLSIERLVVWLSGAELDADYRAMLTEELAIDGDSRVPQPVNAAAWPPANSTDYPVVVIGAGLSGILAAHRLQQAGIDFVVFDKNDDVGGTWLENSYPGCRVDVFNHVYSYSCAQRPDWPEYHSSQTVLLDYFRECASRWGIRDRIRFATSVESLCWDDTANHWTIKIRRQRDDASTGSACLAASGVVGASGPSNGDDASTGSACLAASGVVGASGPSNGDDASTESETVTAGAVISAVGQLNRPLIPDIAGANSFAGVQFHSSAWRHDIDWSDKRVAVIGTGASALQFIPWLAENAEHLTIFQRTPPWLIPRPLYHKPLAEGLLRLFETVPGYANWFRLRLFWCTHEGTVAALRRDPAWDGPLERSVSPRNEQMRQGLTMYLQSEFADRPDLLAKVLPDYPVGSKRVVLDNGVWAATLKRPDVELMVNGIASIEPQGVRDADGRLHEADVVVYGTGFRASEFLMPMRVTGRHGIDLHEQWDGDARAYNGACVPGFPNLFCVYGPNTNIVINGSIIYFSECGVHYAVECLRLLAEQGRTAMDCHREAYDDYAALMDEHNAQMAWGISRVNSWYKNPKGRVTQNWPLPLIDYWRRTRHPNPTDFEFL